MSPLLWIGFITLACHCFEACAVLHVTLQTRVNQQTPYMFIAAIGSAIINYAITKYRNTTSMQCNMHIAPIVHILSIEYENVDIITTSCHKVILWGSSCMEVIQYDSLYRIKAQGWYCIITILSLGICSKPLWRIYQNKAFAVSVILFTIFCVQSCRCLDYEFQVIFDDDVTNTSISTRLESWYVAPDISGAETITISAPSWRRNCEIWANWRRISLLLLLGAKIFHRQKCVFNYSHAAQGAQIIGQSRQCGFAVYAYVTIP